MYLFLGCFRQLTVASRPITRLSTCAGIITSQLVLYTRYPGRLIGSVGGGTGDRPGFFCQRSATLLLIFRLTTVNHKLCIFTKL